MSSEPVLPAAIGRYRPVGLLGTGAMGTVYRAHDPLIDRMVAVKVVRTDALDADTKAEFLERFRLEVQAAGRCSHPVIVGVYDFVADAGNPSIVMELVEGATLQQILRDPARRASLPAVAVLLQVLGGLGYAHGQGVTHRDIKPANIMVTPSGQAKIADFGIARLSETSLTRAGAMLGTPNYMAPEQVADERVDRRADLFSVGAILYECLAGNPPFAGRGVANTILRLTGPQAADMAPVAAAGAGGFVPVLQRALAKDPAQRFQTADEFVVALQSVGQSVGGSRPAAAADATIIASVVPASAANRTHWDPATLQRVERQLARHVGPIARLMVSHAAQSATSAEQLHTTLAQHVQDPADRSAFLRALAPARAEPSGGGFTRPGATSAGQTAGALPAATASGQLIISAEAIATAVNVLASFVGPIARVLVRDAAARAASPPQFLDALCTHVTRADEVAALRRRLRIEVEPRLP